MTTRPLNVYVIQGRGQRDYADCQTALDRVPARLESLPFIGEAEEVVLFGIGGGWNREEMEHHGTSFDRRRRVLRERVPAMKARWPQEEATFHGEFVNFDRAISYPKPAQTPQPPILFGGATAQERARVVEYCDGWIPIDVRLDDLPAAIADLKRKAEAAGRRPGVLSVPVFAFQPPTPDAVKRRQDMGVERVTLLSPRRLADALPFLDRMATLHASKR